MKVPVASSHGGKKTSKQTSRRCEDRHFMVVVYRRDKSGWDSWEAARARARVTDKMRMCIELCMGFSVYEVSQLRIGSDCEMGWGNPCES